MLALSIFIPALTGLFMLLLPETQNKNGNNSHRLSRVYFLPAFFAVLLSGVFLAIKSLDYVYAYSGFQLSENLYSGDRHGFHIKFALDSISLPLLVLTIFLFLVAVIFSRHVHSYKFNNEKILPYRERTFWMSLLFLLTAVLGIFAAQNLLLFFIFWEMFLIPMLILLGVFGGPEKKKTALKFFLFTFAGSVFLIFAIVGIVYFQPQTVVNFDITSSLQSNVNAMSGNLQKLIFWFFLISLLVKMPAFPLHTWLPLTHTQAPVQTLLLSGLMLKLGSYGMLRFILPLFPGVLHGYAGLLLMIGIFGIIYGALVAYRQNSLKMVIAYSSLSHMGFILAGSVTNTEAGIHGAYLQMINHSIINAFLFILSGILYLRQESDNFADLGGINRKSIFFTGAFLIAVLAAVGLPGTNGFVGEFFIILGVFKTMPIPGFFTVSGVVLGAMYMLRMYHKVCLGETKFAPVLVLTKIEKGLLSVFVILVIFLGFNPSLITDIARYGLRALIFARG